MNIRKKLKEKIVFLILNSKKYKVEDSIIIFSEARGGSTWLMEILSNIPKTVINWEPLHRKKGVVPKRFNWGWRPAVKKDDQNPENYNLIKSILEFRAYSKWSASLLLPLGLWRLFRSSFVLTKFIRANNLASFIVNNYQLKNKPILLIRHPIDLCLSQQKAFHSDRTKQKSQDIKHKRFAKRKDLFQILNTNLEVEIATWCINSGPLLKDKDTLSKLTIVFYSDLLMDPEKETLRIFEALDCVSKSDMQHIIKSINFRKPSRTDFNNNLNSNPEKQLNKNFEKLNQLEKEGIQKIFDYFQFELFNAYRPYPNKENILNN